MSTHPVGEARAGAGQAASRERAPGEFDGVRPWQRGDTLRQVVWKKFAKSGELVSHDTQHLQRQQLWLDFARTGAPDAESRLSRLAAWVLAADAHQLKYSLRLPAIISTSCGAVSGRVHRFKILGLPLAVCSIASITSLAPTSKSIAPPIPIVLPPGVRVHHFQLLELLPGLFLGVFGHPLLAELPR